MVDYYLYKQKPNFVKGIEEIQGTKTIDLLFDFFGKCESEILRIDILYELVKKDLGKRYATDKAFVSSIYFLNTID